MNLSTIEALAIAWARIAEEAELPAGYEGTATPEAHRACEVIQERIREHVVATNDMRLFGLLPWIAPRQSARAGKWKA